MTPPSAEPPWFARPSVRFAATLALAAVVIAWRRWPQFAHPAVWIEEGNSVLPSLIRSGWLGAFLPTGGYLIVPSKLLSAAALELSFLHYPIVATVLTTLVQAACAAAVAVAPTHLRARLACALAVPLVPTGPEVFAIVLHAFWWTALLVFPALLWRGGARQAPRLGFLVVAGLSSPLIAVVAPLFVLRAAWDRRRAETAAAGLAVAFGALQVAVLATSHTHSAALLGSLSDPALLLGKFVGTAVFATTWSAGLAPSVLWGAAVLALLLAGAALLPRPERFFFALLLFCLAGAVLASIGRVPAAAPHPQLAGPRYFFYPVVLLLWMLIWLVAAAPRPAALAAAVAIGAFVPSLAADFDFALEQPLVPWERQVKDCAASPGPFTFLAQFSHEWDFTLAADDCRRLLRRSLFR